MDTPSQNGALLEKWRKCISRERTEVITAFLNECGEHATWEDWRNFLQNYHVNGFEWTQSVD